MATREALNKLPPKCEETLRQYGVLIARYKEQFAGGHSIASDYLDEYQNKLNGYLNALVHCGVISNTDFRCLLLYFLGLKGSENK